MFFVAGFFTPGVCALFLLGFFWKRTTANGALGAAIGSAVLSLGFKLAWPALPFIDRVGIVFLLCMLRSLVTTLESVNLENNTFKLREPDGSVNEYVARVPENQKRTKVGDLVVITVTNTVAIVVEEQPAE